MSKAWIASPRPKDLRLLANTLAYVRFIDDLRVFPRNNLWADTGASGFSDEKVYVVQTLTRIAERCILMATDPGDLVLDPTCGSGTTATVAEQWGRRWITIDTSRVALALARAADERALSLLPPRRQQEGRTREQEVTGKILADVETHGDIRQGFVYERAAHHLEVHRQQRRDRRHLGDLAADPGAAAGAAERGAGPLRQGVRPCGSDPRAHRTREHGEQNWEVGAWGQTLRGKTLHNQSVS
jgi:hypothetical protein